MGTAEQLNFDEFDGLVREVKAIAQDAVNDGTAMHTVEKELLKKLLQLRYAPLGAMFQSAGTGDVGETLAHPDHNKPLNRYPDLSTRSYRCLKRRQLYATSSQIACSQGTSLEALL